MQPLKKLSDKLTNTQVVFSDLDDTLTSDGKLGAKAYQALWDLRACGVDVVVVTGRPAGWAEMMARLWPIRAVIGENGAFYFCYDKHTLKMKRVFADSQMKLLEQKTKLVKIGQKIISEFPGTKVSSDQFCRMVDFAIDFAEDVSPAFPFKVAARIKERFKAHGAQAKVSSIHVNAWFGDHDKLSMVKSFIKNEMQTSVEALQDKVIFVGDSPNDEPLFAAFKYSIGVAGIKDFKKEMKSPPKFITTHAGGQGFCEIVHLIKQAQPSD